MHLLKISHFESLTAVFHWEVIMEYEKEHKNIYMDYKLFWS